MTDDRLYPADFLATYRRVFLDDPPERFREAYELLADGFYFGLGLQPERPPIRHSSRGNGDAFFREPRLLIAKFVVDSRLARASHSLRAWSSKGASPQAVRRASLADRRSHLAQVRRAGRASAHVKEEG